MKYISDWETFLIDNADEKIFTIQHENWEAGDFKIVESIELPNKDILIGCKRVCVEEIEIDGDIVEELTLADVIIYFKLSEIELTDVSQTEYYSFLKDSE